MAWTRGRRNGINEGSSVLTCTGVEVAYGPVQVLFGVDLEVREGECVALLGTNGAGKSTLLRAVSGTVPVNQGRIVFGGRDVTHSGGRATASSGIVHVPGGRGVFPSLTVGENLRVAAWLHRDDPGHVETQLERVLELFPALRDGWDVAAGDMSGGQQQMLTLAQALLAKPRLLLIDELSLGLAPALVQQLLDVVRALRDEGITIVLVEQSVNIALSVCERAVFLEKGRVRFEGRTADLTDRPDLLRSVFLADSSPTVPAAGRRRESGNGYRPHPSEDALLAARDLTRSFGGVRAVDRVDLAVATGEVVGVIGANGAGKTTLFDLLSGALAPDAGRVELDGVDVTAWPADRRARAGLGRSFQDARLFPTLTVAETVAVAHERHHSVRDPLAAALGSPAGLEAERATTRAVDELLELLNLGELRDRFVSELSTGSRRIVDLACTLAHRPRVLLLDEPSAGIAQREVEALVPMLRRIQEATGASMVVIDHDMPLVTSVADRLVALETGRVIAVGDPATVLCDERVVRSYLGTDHRAVARSGTTRPA